MKKNICLILLLTLTSCGFYEKMHDLRLKKIKSSFFETDHYGIRKKPITNREYLIFFCWEIETYGDSYPSKILKLLPVGEPHPKNLHQIDFSVIFKHAKTPIFRDYILNPKFIDFPLLGLTKTQVTEMMKWMNDRYNENILIELGSLIFSTEQWDDECFVLESYLLDQYEGIVRNGKRLSWEDNKFLPCFRLPYKNEIDFLDFNEASQNTIRLYKFTSKDFLWKWNANYLQINTSKKEIKFTLRKPFAVKFQTNFNTEHILLTNEMLDKQIDIYENIRYLDEAPLYKETNNYGHREFILIGQSKLGKPFIANQMVFQHEVPSENKLYWITYSKTINF